MIPVFHCTAAVSCTSSGPRLDGVRFRSGTTGKLGRAWVGAWVMYGMVHGWCMGGGDGGGDVGDV